MLYKVKRILNTTTGYYIDNLILDEDDTSVIISGHGRAIVAYYSDSYYIGVDFDKSVERFNDPVELFCILTEFIEEYNDDKLLKYKIEKAIMNEVIKMFIDGADKIGIY